MGVGPGEGEGAGEGDGGGEGWAEGDGDGLARFVGEGEAEGVAEGEALGEAEGDADGVALQPPDRKMYSVSAPLQPLVIPEGCEYQSRILVGRALTKRFITVLPTCSP